MTIKKENEIWEEEEKIEKEELATYRVRNEGVRDERCSEKALRRLSRSIEEVRLHSQHRQICACVYVLLIRSHSFFSFFFSTFFSHIQTKTKETSCLRFENNHFLSFSLLFSLFFYILQYFIGRKHTSISLVHTHLWDTQEEEEKKREYVECLSKIVNQQ
mgnify:FL=1